jgi:pyridoxal phosphate enzyme (YggS family)
MVQLIEGVTAERVRTNLTAVRERIAATGRDPETVEILAAVKYLPPDALVALAQGGIRTVGENRAQELERKRSAPGGDAFTWDFIGQLQSRKVRDILPRVRYIHSVASDSVLGQLQRHGDPDTRVLIEVNVAGEQGKGGILPEDLPAFLERCPVTVVGLMTMPPLAADPESNRSYFATLRELGSTHGLPELSMGTSQDFAVAASEGATIVRLGTILYADAP